MTYRARIGVVVFKQGGDAHFSVACLQLLVDFAIALAIDPAPGHIVVFHRRGIDSVLVGLLAVGVDWGEIAHG